MTDPRRAGAAKTLTCLHDNVSVPAERPACLHPSSFCRFREFCDVIDAMRSERRVEGDVGTEDSGDGD